MGKFKKAYESIKEFINKSQEEITPEDYAMIMNYETGPLEYITCIELLEERKKEKKKIKGEKDLRLQDILSETNKVPIDENGEITPSALYE